MFKDTTAYKKGLKRIDFLKKLEETVRLSQDDAYELYQLEIAVQRFEDQLDAEAKGEYDFMVEFEDRFLASQYR